MREKSFQASIGEEIRKCPDCGSEDLTKHDDEIVCNKCGSVIEE